MFLQCKRNLIGLLCGEEGVNAAVEDLLLVCNFLNMFQYQKDIAILEIVGKHFLAMGKWS